MKPNFSIHYSEQYSEVDTENDDDEIVWPERDRDNQWDDHVSTINGKQITNLSLSVSL